MLPALESDHMETEQEGVDNHGSDDNDNTGVTTLNGNTSNGNVDSDHTADNNMEIETSHSNRADQNSLTSNPARLQSLVKYVVDSRPAGQGLYILFLGLAKTYKCSESSWRQREEGTIVMWRSSMKPSV